MKTYNLSALANVLELVSDKIKMGNWDFNHRGTTLFNKYRCNISSYSIVIWDFESSLAPLTAAMQNMIYVSVI